MIRVGLRGAKGALPEHARSRGYPVLVSAARLWTGRSWRIPLEGLDAALDSGAYGVSLRGGDYPWTIDQYAELVAAYPWAWCASMDVIGDPVASALNYGRMAGLGVIPVWQTLACARAMPAPFAAIGGVRTARPLRLRRLLDEFALIAPQTCLHLFGVTGAAWWGVRDRPSVVSTDSTAWDLHARLWCRKNGEPHSMHWRCHFMSAWLERQEGRARTVVLPGAPASSQLEMFGCPRESNPVLSSDNNKGRKEL